MRVIVSRGDRSKLPGIAWCFEFTARSVFLLLTVVACVSPSFAQEPEVNQGISLVLANELRFDSNVLRQQINPLSSRVWRFSSQLNYKLEQGGSDLELTHNFEHNRYLDSARDTYTNQVARLNFTQALNSTNRITVLAGLAKGYEPRGLGVTEGTSAQTANSPTGLNIGDLGIRYQLGRDLAKIRLIADLGITETDRDSALIANDSRDHTTTTQGLQLLYKVGSRTNLVLEHQARKFDYARTSQDETGNPLNLDSKDQRNSVGVNLEATAKTVGRVRVGKQSRNFQWRQAVWEDDPPAVIEEAAQVAVQRRPDNRENSALYWELAAVWSPRTYSRFEINAQTSTSESLVIGTFVRHKDIALQWVHDWNARLRTQLDYAVGRDVYEGTSREDRRRVWGAKIDYAYSRAVHAGYGYTDQHVNSSFRLSGFDRSMHYLFVNYRREAEN